MARRPNGLRIDDPAFPLLQALISYWGVTTANGGAGGATLICADLVNQPEFDGNQVVIISGPYGGQARDINGTTLLGTVTPASNFGGVITANTIFAILPFRTVPAEVAAIITSQGRQLFTMDFWSNPQEEIQVPAVAATLVITPVVNIADLPGGATIVRAIGMFKFRMVENTYDGANALDGASVADTSQVIQVKETTAGAYIDAINFADNQFTFTALGREGGDVFIGQVDVAAQVDAIGSYTFQWKMRKADGDFIIFNDIQMGIKIYYSI